MDHDHETPDQPPSFWSSRYAVGLLVIGAAAAYYLLTEHLAHVAGALPWLLLLACPLMHVFMHHGHGAHGHGQGGGPPIDDSSKSSNPRPGESA
ncbi:MULTISPECIES: DUF2933 domain-containing protein [Rhodoferax]|uniref:DUF2933 domain-containing protein n=1 Tax=Rhodoferax fermentans TaxID=28066 RepID=A0A1T1AMY3_RHOFE|nr:MULTISPECIES: DUF2933 domain-containing protein [Rhodoferax]MBK1683956.1 DUF2933 domain-containing protein [Rhodoferax fermentans]OOV05377.1 hypothetical protein RF819_00460 [Rhodoferax fermentans]